MYLFALHYLCASSRLSLVAVSRDTLHFWVQASHCGGCLAAGQGHRLGTQASVVGALGLRSCWHTGLVALRQVESSLTGDHTHVPRIGRQILSCTAWEIHTLSMFLRC